MSVNVPKKVWIKDLPYGNIEVDTDNILCNDIVFPGEYNPNHTGLWVIEIGHGYSSSFIALWGHEYDALDVAVDNNMLDCLQMEDEDMDDQTEHEDKCLKPADVSMDDWHSCNDTYVQCCNYTENFTRLGNASEAFDLNDVGLREVNLSKQDQSFMMLLAEARGANVDKLSDL